MKDEFRHFPSLVDAAVTAPLAAPLTPGNRLSDRYQILRLLGEGGFSYTFLAEDCHWPSLRHCAVKQLKAPFQASWEEAKRLFFAEAQTLEQLGKHPQIPELYAYFEENQQFFLVQEYVEGQSLAAELHLDAPQPALKSEAAARALLQEILEILVFVHDHRAIHRDIKPDNLLRRRDGRLELIDFGAVKLAASQLLSRQGLPTLAIGTPGYCPPEQQRGTPFLSSDIYAAGMVAVAALTGRSPHLLAVDPGTGAVDWQELVSISPGLRQILETMTHPDHRQRYPSAREALQAVRGLVQPTEVQQTVAVTPRPVSLPITHTRRSGNWLVQLAIALGLLGGAVAAYWGWMQWQEASNAAALVRRGNTLAKLQKYEEARSAYEAALQYQPEDFEARLGLAAVLRRSGQYQAALSLYEMILSQAQRSSQQYDAWLGYGLTLQGAGQSRKAIAAFEEAIAVDKGEPEAWLGLAESYGKTQQYREAAAAFGEVVRLDSQNLGAWLQQAGALYQLGDYEKAIAAYQKALDIDGYNPDAWDGKGNVHVRLGQFGEAAAAYERAGRYQSNGYGAWFKRGQVLTNSLRRYEEAAEAYQQAAAAAQTASEKANALYQRGWSLHQAQRYDGAIAAYGESLEVNGQNEAAWYNLGNVYFLQQNYEKAADAYGQALDLRSDNLAAGKGLVTALFKLERYEAAIAAADRVLARQTDEQVRAIKQQAQQKLAQLRPPEPLPEPESPADTPAVED